MRTGSIRTSNINGISYNVAADTNASKTPTVEVEAVPHSGGNAIKHTKASGNVEGLTLIVNDAEFQTLEAIRDSLEDVPMSYTKADGSVWTSQGTINVGNYETEENRCEITMISSTGLWDLFSA